MEFEIKFSVPEAARLDEISADPLVQQASCGEAQTIEMETTYLDTPDGMLGARKWTLRRRLENGCSVITCKTPADGYARHEWDYEAPDALSAIPTLISLGAPALLADIETLIPVCGARFTRRALLLQHAEFTAELALDRGILFRGETECPLCELELELKDGSGDSMLAFAAQLCGKYGLCEEKKSKFARARTL